MSNRYNSLWLNAASPSVRAAFRMFSMLHHSHGKRTTRSMALEQNRNAVSQRGSEVAERRRTQHSTDAASSSSDKPFGRQECPQVRHPMLQIPKHCADPGACDQKIRRNFFACRRLMNYTCSVAMILP